MCKICHKDSSKHSTKLWRLHQLKVRCTFCGKTSDKHSEELWKMHEDVVPKNAKVATINLGFGPKTPVRLVEWNTLEGSPYHIERVPIHFTCSECGSSMSNTESDLADVLSHLCLECFCEQTDQEYTWHSKPWF